MQGSSLSVNNEAGNDILKKINEEVSSIGLKKFSKII